MPLLTIPNLSTSSATELNRLIENATGAGVRCLDLHRDAEHGRSVITFTGSADDLVDAMTGLAFEAFTTIDLASHDGRHPRVGALDVCPFVPHDIEMDVAIEAARRTGLRIGAAGVPVFYYGEASQVHRSLPEIRTGGLTGLVDRVHAGDLSPDEGPVEIDLRRGVVCVGARGPLIAFNVWIDGPVDVARLVAAHVRAHQAIRALGLDVTAHGASQVSMNLIDPQVTGIDAAFEMVERAAAAHGAVPVATELVGLVADRFLPNPDATAARLLVEPGRSLDAALVA